MDNTVTTFLRTTWVGRNWFDLITAIGGTITLVYGESNFHLILGTLLIWVSLKGD